MRGMPGIYLSGAACESSQPRPVEQGDPAAAGLDEPRVPQIVYLAADDLSGRAEMVCDVLMGDKGAVTVLLHGNLQQEPGDLRAQRTEEILVDVIQNILGVAGGRLDNILRCCRAAVCQTRKLCAAYISDGGVAHCLKLRHYIPGTGTVGGEDIEHIAGAHDEDRHFSAGAGYHIDPDDAVQNYQHPVLFLAGKGEGLPGAAALVQQT